MTHIFVGAALIGGIALIAGFVGPVVFMPQSNQGPLLGIFVTGPLDSPLAAFLARCIHGLASVAHQPSNHTMQPTRESFRRG